MNIIKPYARITPDINLNIGILLLKSIEKIGKVSHRNEENITDASWERFIQSVVLQHGDWSITEHKTITVEMVVDRGITHEIVRHRIGAYTQESTRFVNYEKKLDLSFIAPYDAGTPQNAQWLETMYKCEEAYKHLVTVSTPQFARSVLPNSLASKIIITYNLRNWRHFFIMRTTKESHPQMREVTIPLLAEFQKNIPLLYDDIIPESRQIDNLRLPR